MPTMQDVRAKFPQYDDMDDAALAGALHRKFYSDMPETEFLAKIGLAQNSGGTDANPMVPPTGGRQDANGQRYDESGVPIGGASMPATAAAPAKASAGGQFGGAALNATAGVNEGIYGTLGLPVDAVRGAINLGVRGLNAATGSDIGQIPENSFGGSRFIAETLGGIRPELDPRNTVAVTEGEQLARATGQGVGSTIAPAAVVGGVARAGMASPSLTAMGERLFGGTGSAGTVLADAAVGGAAGLGAKAAEQAAPDEYKSLAALGGGLVSGGLGALTIHAPIGVMQGGRQAVDTLIAPLTASGRGRLAADQLRTASSDPAALRTTLEDLPAPTIAGSRPTTFQATGDMGLGALERKAQTLDPVPFMERRADQNTARRAALDTVGGDGSPEAVTRSVRSYLRSIETDADTAIDAARTAARDRAMSFGSGQNAETVGIGMREALEAARANAKAQERALWSAVDPDGSLVTPATRVGNIARQMIERRPASAKQPEGEEAAILATLSQYGDAVPFSEAGAMRSRLSDALRTERRQNGETQTYRTLSALRGALEADLNAGISRQVARDAEAVAAGTMQADQTIIARLRQGQENFVAGSQANARVASGGTGAVGYGAGGSATVSGAYGAGSEAGGRSIPSAGDPRLASGEPFAPNFDAAAQERLTAAGAATRQRAETFDNKTLAPIRRRPSTTAPYDMPAARVPGVVFSSKPGSAEAIRAYRTAVGDEQALPALEAYAVGKLRQAAMNEDGTLDPRRLATWRRKYTDALGEFPALDARLQDAEAVSARFVDVAAERASQVAAGRVGALGKLMGVDDPADVSRVVGGLFGRQDSVAQFTRLKQAIGNDTEAMDGLRRAAADHIASRLLSNTEAATSGQTLIKADQFQTFIRQNRTALEEVFSPAQVRTLDGIAADLNQANRSQAAVRIPGQSNTAQDQAQLASGSPASIIFKIAATSGSVGALAGITSNSLIGVAATIGTGLLGAMRENGLRTVQDIVADALLNPERAHLLLTRHPPKAAASVERTLAQRYRRSAAALFADDDGENGGGNVAIVEGASPAKRQPLEITIGRPR